MCLLRELYGAGVEKLRIEHQTIVVRANNGIFIDYGKTPSIFSIYISIEL